MSGLWVSARLLSLPPSPLPTSLLFPVSLSLTLASNEFTSRCIAVCYANLPTSRLAPRVPASLPLPPTCLQALLSQPTWPHNARKTTANPSWPRALPAISCANPQVPTRLLHPLKGPPPLPKPLPSIFPSLQYQPFFKHCNPTDCKLPLEDHPADPPPQTISLKCQPTPLPVHSHPPPPNL